jgi:hypothetical protein
MLAHSASQASRTPEKSHSEESRKRKRDILSCLACRQRKLKCDRGYPSCNRCVKGGNASSCTYHTFPGNGDQQQEELDVSAEEDSRAQKRGRGFHDGHPANVAGSANEEVFPGDDRPGITLSNQSYVIKSLEHRLATLESMLSKHSSTGCFQLEGSRPVVTAASRQDARAITEPGTHIFKGRGLRTQFYGPSNPTSLLAHVRLSRFCFGPGSQLMITVSGGTSLHERGPYELEFAKIPESMQLGR